MLNLQWVATGAGVLLALVAVLWARRVTKRLDRLSQSYWELRYEHGQLIARVGRLEPLEEGTTSAGALDPPDRPKTAFVPLSSLKKPSS